MILTQDIQQVFVPYFVDMAGVVGSEATLQALFCHHLLAAGWAPNQIARELRMGAGPVDVVLFDGHASGRFTEEAQLARVAIEFKGGAYGNRNALHDTIDANGYCPDIAKLAPLQAAGLACWFICVDLAELGVALKSTAKRELVAARCRELNIGFAYFCTAKRSCLLQAPGEYEMRNLDVIPRPATGVPSEGALVETGTLQTFGHLAAMVRGSEADYSSLLYHTLRGAGLSAQQVSLETYFSFATTSGSRMQWRPDLTLFNPAIAGRFNLYRGGDKRFSNDAIKLQNLAALVEIKGSLALVGKSDAALEKIYREDIAKLVRWREAASWACKHLLLKVPMEPELVFVAIDPRGREMVPTSRAALMQHALAQGVKFHYLTV